LKGPLTLGVALSRKLPVTTETSANPTPTPTASPTPENQASPTPTTTASPTPENQASPTPTTTASPTPENQASPTPTATATPPTEQKSEQPAKESRLVVIGNSDFATNNIFQQQLNGDVFLNSVTWLSQQDQQPLSIRPKEPKNRRITLSTSQANLLTVLSLAVLPLLGFVAAVFMWWKRR
jgi:ABC-type uncharacterized transport system involved in gliding motility auxiliary subunit